VEREGEGKKEIERKNKRGVSDCLTGSRPLDEEIVFSSASCVGSV
jgi:hypothetical protein